MKKIRQFHNRAHRTAETKMKKLMNFFMPLKMFATAVFAGFMILYMVSGIVYSYVAGEDFTYVVPFVFVLQGLLLSAMVSLVWGLLFSDVLIKKWRVGARLIAFAASFMALMTICVITFVAIPTDWAQLWLITNGCIGFGLIVFSIVNEMRLKATGRRYTELLNKYKAEHFK